MNAAAEIVSNDNQPVLIQCIEQKMKIDESR